MRPLVRFLFLLTVTFATGAPAFCADSRSISKIAFILPLSGEGAALGLAVRNGAILAHESLPQNGRDSIELVFEDDKLQPTSAVTAFQRVRAIPGVIAVTLLSSATSKAVAPLAEAAGIPMLAIASDPDICSDRKYVMNLWVTPETLAEAAFREAKRRGYRRIARVRAQQSGVEAIAHAFDQAAKGELELVLDEEYPEPHRDFRSSIAKIRAARQLDGVAVVLLPGQIGLFARNARASRIQLPLFGFELMENPDEVAAHKVRLSASGTQTSLNRRGTFSLNMPPAFPVLRCILQQTGTMHLSSSPLLSKTKRLRNR